jgi:hypothetical protein
LLAFEGPVPAAVDDPKTEFYTQHFHSLPISNDPSLVSVKLFSPTGVKQKLKKGVRNYRLSKYWAAAGTVVSVIQLNHYFDEGSSIEYLLLKYSV